MSSSDTGEPSDRSLGEVALAFAAGEADAHAVHEAFLRATLWCEAGDQPGFQALGTPGAGMVPVFTSETELARARGAVRWFSTTGADLLDLLPEHYDVVVDIAGEAPLRLRPAALRRTVVAEIDWKA
jgi:SseB protein N-terminal domain